MSIQTRKMVASCPDCDEQIDLGPRPTEGQRLTCFNCGAQLEIINLEPPELDWAFSDFEPDWDPDEEEWEEEEEEEWGEEDWDGKGSGMDGIDID